MIERIYLDVDIENLTKEIQDNTEWMWVQTSVDDELECISIENLETILTRFLNIPIKLKQDEGSNL